MLMTFLDSIYMYMGSIGSMYVLHLRIKKSVVSLKRHLR